jgi:hypothetical protein
MSPFDAIYGVILQRVFGRNLRGKTARPGLTPSGQSTSRRLKPPAYYYRGGARRLVLRISTNPLHAMATMQPGTVRTGIDRHAADRGYLVDDHRWLSGVLAGE